MASELVKFRPVTVTGTGGRRPAAAAATSPLRILHLVEAFGGGVFEVLRQLASDSAARGHCVGVAYGVRLETPEDIGSRLHGAVELIPTAWQRRSLTANVRAHSELRAAHRPLEAGHSPSPFRVCRSGGRAACAARSADDLHTACLLVRDAQSLDTTPIGLPRPRGIRQPSRRHGSRRVPGRGSACTHRAWSDARDGVIENGIPELDDGVAIRDRRRTPPLIVGMGRISPQRQPEACARILGAVRSISEVRWIGGGAPASAGARALVDAEVPITGWTDRRAALDQLREADIYLHWTAWDGHPLSILEAIARDVIVIAHDIPAIRNVLDPRQLCRNEAEAVDLIHRVLSNESLREDLLSLQRRKAPRYQASRMLAEWDALYGKLATNVADDHGKPWVLKPAQAH